MSIPRNLTQLKKFFAPGMEIRYTVRGNGNVITVPIVKVQTNAIVLGLPCGRRSWIHWDKPAADYEFDEKGFSYFLADGIFQRFEYVTLKKPEVVEVPKAPKPNPNLFVGPDAVQKAKQKARYGHKDWLYYCDKAGQLVAEKLTSESVKRALLNVGTQGHFTEIAASTAQGYFHCWNSGINRMHHARYVEKHGPLF